MSNRNNPDPEQDEQERLEQERLERERTAAALRAQLRQSPEHDNDDPSQDSSKNPVIINKIDN